MNPLEQYITKLRQELERVRGLDWTPPDPPEDPPSFADSRLKPVTESALPQKGAPVPLQHVRDELPRIVENYIESETDGPSMLLIKVPAGVGKTHTLSEVVQEHTSGRVLWMAARHSAWEDLSGFAHFNGSFWHHWLGAGQKQDNGEPMCKFSEYMTYWQALGYPSWRLCKMLCEETGHTAVCPYATQKDKANEKQCVLGMHNALAIGVNTKGYDLAVVDELAMQALVKNRVIPGKDILINSSGPVQELLTTMQMLAIKCPDNVQIRAKELFDKIGPILTDVYAQVELEIGALPAIPYIKNPQDVTGLEYWFLNEFLLIAAQEHEAWRRGWDDWASRVLITKRGLNMLSKLELWDKLPYKLIVLDATGKTELYKSLYGRKIIEYAPNVEHIGRVHQITGRLNSKRQLYAVNRQMRIEERGAVRSWKEIVPKPAFYEAVDVMRALMRYHNTENVGVISYKDLDDALIEEFGKNVLHFYGLRGTNILAKVDLLFVLGSPAMRFQDIVNTAVTLDPDRRKAFGGIDTETGRQKPLYKPDLREYRLSGDALKGIAEVNNWKTNALRGVERVVGAYTDNVLAMIHQQYSSAEIRQAFHRVRINSRKATAYIMTSTPIEDEMLDGISDDPHMIGPAGIYWKTWLQLAFEFDQLPEGAALWACDVAFAAGKSEKYVKDNGWIDAILEFYEQSQSQTGRWFSLRMRDPRLESRRGRFPKAMVKGIDPAHSHLDTNSVIVMEKPENVE